MDWLFVQNTQSLQDWLRSKNYVSDTKWRINEVFIVVIICVDMSGRGWGCYGTFGYMYTHPCTRCNNQVWRLNEWSDLKIQCFVFWFWDWLMILIGKQLALLAINAFIKRDTVDLLFRAAGVWPQRASLQLPLQKHPTSPPWHFNTSSS